MPQRPYGITPPGYCLPEATQVGGVRLQVSALGRSVAHYEQALRLRLHAAADDAATLGPHGGERTLVTLQIKSGVAPARRGAFGLYHFAILLPERAALGRFAAHLSALGVRFGMADHVVSEALYLSDPDGLGIEVYAYRPRSAWRHRDRELPMTTDPLDIGSLIKAGGGDIWDGAPAGTTIGHVHLHVGSLDAAEAFYHRAIGFDKTVWSYPGALFFSAGGYHHHLATNTWSPGPAPRENEARLLQWELIAPAHGDPSTVGRSLQAAGFPAEAITGGVITADPWGTRLQVRTQDYSEDRKRWPRQRQDRSGTVRRGSPRRCGQEEPAENALFSCPPSRGSEKALSSTASTSCCTPRSSASSPAGGHVGGPLRQAAPQAPTEHMYRRRVLRLVFADVAAGLHRHEDDPHVISCTSVRAVWPTRL